MGRMISLTARDGHSFSAYEKVPTEGGRGGLVVVQEIFGVNAHIRRVADGYAADGYHVIAPAIFDRAERDIELGYEGPDRQRGVGLMQAIDTDDMLADIAACVAALAPAGKIGIVGYCLGGSLAWLASARLGGLSAAVGYYGGMIAKCLDEAPKCPVLLHFGEDDTSIPMADVERMRAMTDPARVQIFAYKDAGHAFNRDDGETFRGEAARVARERTIAFLREHVG